MKKSKFLLTFALFLLSVNSVFAALIKEQNNIHELHTPVVNSYAAEYYSRLINYFGYNTADTCCYVAAGMLMTYYGSFVHTNFVSDSLVVKSQAGDYGYPLRYGSPGNFYEKNIVGNYEAEGTPYTQFINDYKNQSIY